MLVIALRTDGKASIFNWDVKEGFTYDPNPPEDEFRDEKTQYEYAAPLNGLAKYGLTVHSYAAEDFNGLSYNRLATNILAKFAYREDADVSFHGTVFLDLETKTKEDTILKWKQIQKIYGSSL